MAEGGKNPDEPPLKRERNHGEIEEQERSPDILMNVIGSQYSTIGSSNVVGVASGGVGTTSAGPGRTTEKGHTPDEPPLKKLRTLGSNETLKDSLPGNINVTANGPKDSSVTTSTVIGYADSVTVQNDGKGEITMKCQHDYQRKLLDSTKEKILIRTNEMIRVSAVDLMIEKLKHGNNWITITGNAGDGKTTLAHFILKDFADKMNVYVIESPEEYRQISQIVEDRVILLNDIFGAFTFDSSSVNKWRMVVADIFDIQMNRPKGVTNFVFVSRQNILQEVKVHLEKYGEQITDNENWFDLSQMNAENERLQILQYHLDRKGITEEDWVKERLAKMNTLHGFPNCCKMYAELVSKEQDIDIVDFFKTPLKFLDTTTKLLFETGYRDLFINLVKNDGEFNSDSVEDDEKRWKLEKQATRQEGSYLANFDGIWVFRHPSIYESVLSVVAQKDPLLLVKHASISVIRQKVRFRTSRSETPTCFILLDPWPRVLDALAERFLEQLREGDYYIFRLTIGRHEDFIGRLINKLSSLEERSSSDLINKQDMWGHTMLHDAVENSNCPAVRALLAHGADPNICGRFRKTFHTTSCEGRFCYCSFVDHIDHREMTPLHCLCQHEEVSVEVLQLLLNSGTGVNHIDFEGRTPLHYLCASKGMSAEALQLLLISGADINHIDIGGRTPLHYLCTSKGKSVEALQLLLISGADINHIDIEGRTPLHYLCASKRMSVEALQLLLNSGADINHIDSYGRTPLHYLCGSEGVNVEALQLLLNTGSSVNHIESYGRTPLHYLCGSEGVNVEALQLLLNSGSSVNHIDSYGRTPLHYLCASKRMSADALQLLNVAKQCQIPQMICFRSGFSTVVNDFGSDKILSEYQAMMDTLIRNGSDVNKPDGAGNTPLHSVCDIPDISKLYHFSYWYHREFLLVALKALIKGGADVNLQNQNGETPVQVLRKNGYTEAIKLLTN